MYARESISRHPLLTIVRQFISRHPLLTTAIISIAILVLAWWPTSLPPKKFSDWPGPQPMLNQPDQAARLNNPPTPKPIAGEVQAVARFDINVEAGLYPDERRALADDLQRALDYVAARFGSGPSSRFRAIVVRDDSCTLRGIAYTDVRTVQVFSCNAIARQRAVAILAHEFVHQLEEDRYGPAHRSSDIILSEGMATSAAGEYWLGGLPDFRTYVREQRKSGVFYPLATDYTGRGVGVMNALYYQWASFVDFLITSYGREKFDRVYVTGHGDPGTSDYVGVYGKGLDALEQEWRAWLGQ